MQNCKLVISLLIACSLAGCATLSARTPVPPILTTKATVSNLKTARIFGDASKAELKKFLSEGFQKTPKFTITQKSSSGRPIFSVLALSGGGEKGAFGAGIINGWSASGTRPEFTIVTGVSTGALAAPFVFLGPDYDKQLKEIYTKFSTQDLLIIQPIKGLFGGIAITDSSPLAAAIANYIDQDFLKKVAYEYKKGRFLLVATTNIDAQRQVIWNMGAIAASNHKDSLQLFRDVLLASAAVPSLLPPVKINVTANGKQYDELHVDGGVTRQVFLGPPNLSLRSFDQAYRQKPIYRIYIIRNGQTNPEYEIIEPQTLPIAKRSISTLIKSQGLGDLYRIYAVSKREGLDFNLITIPQDLKNTSKEPFDKIYMTKLYDRGYEIASKGIKWLKTPTQPND